MFLFWVISLQNISVAAWDDYRYLKYIPLVHILGIYTVHVLVKYFTKLFWILTVWLIIYTDGIGGLEFSRNLEIFIELIRQPLFNPLPMSRFSCIVKLSTNWWCNTDSFFPLVTLPEKTHSLLALTTAVHLITLDLLALL